MSTNPDKLEARACPACGGQHAELRHAVGPWRVVACSACGFVYLPVAATPDYFSEGQGAWESSIRETRTRKLKESPLTTRLSMATRFRTKLRNRTPVAFIEAGLAASGENRLSVLDIGCGAGDYLSSLDARFTPYGIELSTGLAARAQAAFAARGGRVVNAATIEALPRFAPQSIDAVVMRSYLEHEPRPREVLAGVRDVLRNGGLAVVKVPNYASFNRFLMGGRWCGFRFPEHVNYFTPDSLRRLAASTGLTFEQRFIDRLPTSDNMWAVLRKA
ncbi:MAG: class I SAM-dependent methyltransferase [Beijerinckiaceae bacterium]